MLDKLNREALLACCGSEAWVEQMLASGPFPGPVALHAKAETIWFSLAPADWLEAFSKHPKIGDKAPQGKWSAQEQRGMSEATIASSDRMKELNEIYERKFGWIFIVCATGKSAAEMRELLEQRLLHDPAEELRIAAAEQCKIMHLRLDKLLIE